MGFDPVSAIFGVAGKVIDRVWPDPEKRDQMMLELKKLEQSGEFKFMEAELQLLLGQIEINKVEAAHGGIYKGGWRPAVGWICAFALAYNFIVQPFLVFVIQTIAFYRSDDKTAAELFPLEFLPQLDIMPLLTLLTGMLGLGLMRTYEKQKSAKIFGKG